MKLNIKSINPFIYNFLKIYIVVSLLAIGTFFMGYHILVIAIHSLQKFLLLSVLGYDIYCIYTNRKFLKKFKCLHQEINLRIVIILVLIVGSIFQQWFYMTEEATYLSGYNISGILILWLCSTLFIFNIYTNNQVERERAIVLGFLPCILAPSILDDYSKLDGITACIAMVVIIALYKSWKFVLPLEFVAKSKAYWSYLFYGIITSIITSSVIIIYYDTEFNINNIVQLLLIIGLTVVITIVSRQLLSSEIVDNDLLKYYIILIIGISQLETYQSIGLQIVLTFATLILIEGGINVWLRKRNLLSASN